ncbi:MAG: MlaD family protein [Alphaproteobacteria bacterium]
METRASYILVGSFVLAFVAGAFAIVTWFAKTEFDRKPAQYHVYFTESVTGLEIGSPVRYRGVAVGSVADIRIDPKNVERVRVTFEVAAETPIKQDTFASLGLQGITGAAYVQLGGGTQESATLVAKEGDPLPVIAAKASGLERLLTKAPELFEKAFVLVERLSALLDDRNRKAVADTLQNLHAVSQNLAASSGSFDQVLTEAGGAVTSLRVASERIEALANSMQDRVGPLADSTRDTMAELKGAIAGIRGTARSFTEVAKLLDKMIAENREPLRDFSRRGLSELSQFIAESRLLVADLTRLTVQIERDPARFFFGDAQKGFEAK